ncbi:hypothetical protein DL346_24500 [Paenibacillus montanisoli]|uniref:Uncharacterized protein n=2 Tax=Paenibacillus montanisoli TaxID=2081970 RepID=A0A328TXM3_9BACL|nr:hypothetical protein DL346_24500 [Paenibacillus montanisoli]
MLLSGNGMTYIWRRSPFTVMWLSAAFPGFGHVLMNQYARGLLLTLSEVAINTLGHVNEAMVYTFCGQFELAKSVLEPRWMYGYLIVYFFSMWSSYRTAFTMNRLSHLAELENTPMTRLHITNFDIQFLERKNPIMAAMWSFFFPGLGFLYNQRIFLGIYAIAWWWIKGTMAHAYDSLFLLFSGRIAESIAVLNPQWLLFMPSVLGGSIYYSYTQTVDQNHLFMVEQKRFFVEQYRGGMIHRFFQREEEDHAHC